MLNEMRSGGAEGKTKVERESEGSIYATLKSEKQTDDGGEPVSSKSCSVLFFPLIVTQLTCQPTGHLLLSSFSSSHIFESLSSSLLFPSVMEDVPVF